MLVQELPGLVNGRSQGIPGFAVIPSLSFRRLPKAPLRLHDVAKDCHAFSLLAGQRLLLPSLALQPRIRLLAPCPVLNRPKLPRFVRCLTSGTTVVPGQGSIGQLGSDGNRGRRPRVERHTRLC